MGSFLPSVGSNRPSLHLFVSLSVCQSVTPSSICQFVSPSTRQSVYPSVHPSVCFSLSSLSVRPSVRPSARPSSFLQLFCQSICLSDRLSVHSFSRLFVLPLIHSSVRFSVHQCVCLSVGLFIPYVDPICPSGHQSVHPFVCPSFQPSIPLSFRSSVRPSNIYLSTMAPGSWLQKFIITTVNVYKILL